MSAAALRREYVEALSAYLDRPVESALDRASDLGARALEEGLGLRDVAAVHEAAIARLVLTAPAQDQAARARGAAEFFGELLSPFDASLRGHRRSTEVLNRELESLSYSISHDLRAPLRSIDGFSKALAEDYGEALDDDGKKYLRFVTESAQRMSKLLDDLLSLARITRGPLAREPVDLTALARRIVERLRASEPGRVVEVTIEDSVIAGGDPRLLEIALESLLGNAWKFTSQRDRAHIAFGRIVEGERTTYFVRDDGAGFDMAYADKKLFGAFQRLHAADEFPGTGIGLTTVQRIVHKHGGEVTAVGAVDQGATFSFTLEPSLT